MKTQCIRCEVAQAIPGFSHCYICIIELRTEATTTITKLLNEDNHDQR